ncbi:MAG: hypothetical protein K2Q09_03480 [Phycisphaerales bacterium]|nr:hypothetical protein [Phycisphaerales bacterium]
MPMPHLFRKLTLTAHVAASVGWLGAAITYLALAVAALASGEHARAPAAYQILNLVGWWVILPLCVGALVTGVVQSLGTRWGVVRHYWVVAKLALTLVMTAVLLGHLPAVSYAASPVPSRSVALSGHGAMPMSTVIHAGGGVAALLAVTAISVFKPWGMTPIGRRCQARAARPVAIPALSRGDT